MPAQGTEKIKKVLPIIYAIDTSGSMSGDRISAVNEAMHDCEEVLREKASDLPESEIKIAALEFSSGAKWITKGGLVALEDFYWNDATAGGVTDLGEALKELDSKLSRSAFLVSETGFSLPVIIFMSDGGPTDNWKKELKAVTDNNRWFKDSRKVAIAIGYDADVEVLKELVGNSEAVIRTNDTEQLKDLIVAVSVSASLLAGQSRVAGDAKGDEIAESAVKELENGDENDPVIVGKPVDDEIDDGFGGDDGDGGWGADDGDWN